MIEDRGYLYVRLYDHGRQIQKSVGRVEAEGALKKGTDLLFDLRRRIRMKRLGLELPERQISIEEACAIFWEYHGSRVRSPKSMDYRLRTIKEYFSGKKFERISYLDVSAFRMEFGKRVSESSVNSVHGTLLSIYRFFEMNKKLRALDPVLLPKENPARLVRITSRAKSARKRVLTTEEFHRLMGAAQPPMRRIIIGAIHTTLRRIDLRRLVKSNVNTETRQLEGIQSKTQRPYAIPINGVIQHLINTAEGEHIFNFTGFLHQWDKLKKACGMPELQFRDLRRTGARTMLRDGLDLASVSSYLGHGKIHETQTYVAAPSTDKHRASKILQGMYCPAGENVLQKAG